MQFFPFQKICTFCSSNTTVVKEYKTKTIKALTTAKNKTFIDELNNYINKKLHKNKFCMVL